MNIVRILKLFFSVILFPAFIFSQSISSEEKFSQIKTLANDQSKCSELYDLGFSIRAEEPLLAYSCAKYLRDISSQLTDTFYLARAYNLLGILHYRNQEFDKAIYYHRNALKWREALKNESEIGASYTNLGNMYSDLENFEMAESYHLKAFSLFQKLKNTKQILNCLCNLGILKQIGRAHV